MSGHHQPVWVVIFYTKHIAMSCCNVHGQLNRLMCIIMKKIHLSKFAFNFLSELRSDEFKFSLEDQPDIFFEVIISYVKWKQQKFIKLV